MSETFYGSEISVDDSKITVPFIPIKDMFNFNQPPYLFIGSTGSGKTVLSLDILHQFSEKANYIYYISQTKPTFGVENPITQIPNIFIRDPSKNVYETINSVWNDIKTRVNSMKLNPEETIIIIKKLYPKTENIIKLIESYLPKLNNVDYSACQIEILTRMIMDKCLNNPNALAKLDNKEQAKVKSLISHSTRSIFIMDDLSSLIAQAQSAKQTISRNGMAIPMGKAFQELLIEIFTVGRHYNCICCFFLHTMGTLDQRVLNNVVNIVLLDNIALRAVRDARSFNVKGISTAIESQIGIFDDKKYKYYIVYIERGTKNNVKISKAQLHSEAVPMNKFVMKYNDFITLIKTTNQPTNNNENLFDDLDLDDII